MNEEDQEMMRQSLVTLSNGYHIGLLACPLESCRVFVALRLKCGFLLSIDASHGL
jgi:hypothetical protein